MESNNQMRCLKDTLTKSMVVRKLMRSLGPKFYHVVVVIKEAKDVTKLTMGKLSGTIDRN